MTTPPGGRYRLGGIFRVSGVPVQPATLPFDDNAARAELNELAENNAGLLTDADTGHRVRTGNPDGRPKKKRPSDDGLWAECEAEQKKVQRSMSATEAAGIVAKRHDLSRAHVLKLTRLYRTG